MARVDVVFLVVSPDASYYLELLGDPAGWLEENTDNLYRIARTRLHQAGLLPVAKGSPWGAVLPGDAPDTAAVALQYGAELGDKLAQACYEHPSAVVLWHVVEVVPKGSDGASQPWLKGWRTTG